MSTLNRPVCSYTRDYRVAELEGELDVECPDPPEYAVLTRNAAGQWVHARDRQRGLMYACGFCQQRRFSVENADWAASALLSPAWVKHPTGAAHAEQPRPAPCTIVLLPGVACGRVHGHEGHCVSADNQLPIHGSSHLNPCPECGWKV